MKAFSSGDEEKALKYAEALRANLKETTDSLRRSGLLLILTMTIFEIVHQNGAESFSIGSFSFKETPGLIAYLPSLVAYFYLEGVIAQRRYMIILTLHTACMRVWHPQAVTNSLHVYVLPRGPLYFGTAIGPGEEMILPEESLDQATNRFIAVVVTTLLVPCFEIYAFVELFITLGASNINVYLNLIATSLLLYLGMRIYLKEPTDILYREP